MQEKNKKIINTILIIMAFIIIIGYFIYSIVSFGSIQNNTICNNITINIKDSSEYKFIHESEIISHLKAEKLGVIDKCINNEQANVIEKSVENMSFVKRAECYKNQSGEFIINIWQRCPVFRVIDNSGKMYYIDNERKKMPTSNNFTALLIVANGDIPEEFAKNELYDFISFLKSNEYWSKLFGQVFVTSSQEVILVSKVGVPIIIIGNLNNYELKLEKLLAWYKQYANKNIENIYGSINLSYEDLIYCTKTDENE